MSPRKASMDFWISVQQRTGRMNSCSKHVSLPWRNVLILRAEDGRGWSNECCERTCRGESASFVLRRLEPEFSSFMCFWDLHHHESWLVALASHIEIRSKAALNEGDADSWLPVGVSVTTMHSISFNPIIPNIEWECVWASKLLEKKRATRTGMVNSILWSGLTALIKLYVVCCLNKLLRKMQLRLGFFLSFRFFSVVLKGLWQPSRQTRASSGRWAACFERKRHSKVWKVVENWKGFAGSVFHLVSESKDSTRSLKVSLATGIPVQELLA